MSVHYTLKQRSNGYWFVEFVVDGERHRPSCKTKHRSEAKKRAPEIVEGYERLLPATRVVGKVSLRHALDAVADSKRNPRTSKMYRDKARTVFKTLAADGNLLELGRDDLDRYVRIRRELGISDHTLNKELTLIRQAWAMHYPAAPCPVPKFSSGYEPCKRWLSLEEASKLLKATGRSTRRTWLMLALYAGTEPAATVRTRWQDVHWSAGEGGELHVRGTKGETRDRFVPLAVELREYLEGLDRDKPLVPGWANPHRDMRRWCTRAGIDACTRTDLRRTFGSWLKQAGVDSRRVADLMGHVNTNMVDRVYGQLNRPAYESAVAKLPRLPRMVAL